MYIQYAYKCNICKDYIVGQYRQLKTCKCNKASIDVGSMNVRVVGDLNFPKKNWTELVLDSDSSIKDINNKLLWGSYSINDEGESLLDLWYKIQPDRESDEYEDWLESKPDMNFNLIKDLESDHILNIILTQKNQKVNILKAFELELSNRGIKIK